MSAIDFSDPSTIALLADALTAAGVSGLEISRPGGQLRIVVAAGEETRIDVSVTARPDSRGVSPAVVRAPMAGHFCPGHLSDSAVSDSLPRPVSGSEVLGFVRIGPVLLPLNAGRPAVLTKRLAEPDALVGFGDPLFEIEPQS